MPVVVLIWAGESRESSRSYAKNTKAGSLKIGELMKMKACKCCFCSCLFGAPLQAVVFCEVPRPLIIRLQTIHPTKAKKIDCERRKLDLAIRTWCTDDC